MSPPTLLAKNDSIPNFWLAAYVGFTVRTFGVGEVGAQGREEQQLLKYGGGHQRSVQRAAGDSESRVLSAVCWSVHSPEWQSDLRRHCPS